MSTIEREIAKALSVHGVYPSRPNEIIIEATLESIEEGLLIFSNQDLEIIDLLIKQRPCEALLSNIAIIRKRAEDLIKK